MRFTVPTRQEKILGTQGRCYFSENILLSLAKHSHQLKGLRERPGPSTRHGCVVHFSPDALGFPVRAVVAIPKPVGTCAGYSVPRF